VGHVNEINSERRSFFGGRLFAVLSCTAIPRVAFQIRRSLDKSGEPFRAQPQKSAAEYWAEVDASKVKKDSQ
jgi:hypothetical protein